MSDEAPKPKKGTIIRARFVVKVKLGGNELEYWAADRHDFVSCEATAAGLVFVGKMPGEASLVAATETVVPWPNVVSYERAR